jgi:hypothetical protein
VDGPEELRDVEDVLGGPVIDGDVILIVERDRLVEIEGERRRRSVKVMACTTDGLKSAA